MKINMVIIGNKANEYVGFFSTNLKKNINKDVETNLMPNDYYYYSMFTKIISFRKCACEMY